MICSDPSCGCGITSSSLSITGSGAPGNPYNLETNAYSIVTSVTRPASPFVGQFIWETNTERQLVWTGSNWLIVGGAMPAWNLMRPSSVFQLIPNNTNTTVLLTDEVSDSDAFHTGTTGVVTIPAGFGGDYLITASMQWGTAESITGARSTIVVITGNTTTPLEHTGPAGVVIAGNAFTATGPAKVVRLEAGAVLTLTAYQLGGVSVNVLSAWFTGTMVRHIPTLT